MYIDSYASGTLFMENEKGRIWAVLAHPPRLTFWAILFPVTAKYAGKSANHVIRMENKDKVLYNRISAAAPLLFLIKHEICRVGKILCMSTGGHVCVMLREELLTVLV